MRPRPKRQDSLPELVDESAESEITITPDGRVFAFGITRPLASLLATLPMPDGPTRRILERTGRLERGELDDHEDGTVQEGDSQ